MRSIVLAWEISRVHAYGMDQNSNTAMSIIFMVTGMAIVGIIDNFIKFIAVEISLWQFHFLRSLIAVPVIVVFGLVVGGI